jgi:hypothetical protein
LQRVPSFTGDAIPTQERYMRKFVLFCSLLFVSASVLGQSSPQTVSEVHVATIKPGTTAQWEAARKEHFAFHAAQKDPWNIYTWQILTGERTGAYMLASPGHNWKDFEARDAFNKVDAPNIQKTVGPYTAETTMAYYVFRDDLSLTKVPPAPAKMRTTTYYTVIPEHVNDFIDAVKKINAAIQKTNYPAKPSRWYALANGGESPTFVQIIDRASWADMEPPEKKLDDALKEAYGETGPQVLKQLRLSCRRVLTELSVYRPDLSYIPK